MCEIWLTSEDTGAYGRDIGTDLPTLLWRLVEEIPQGAMLRLGMTNPPYILEHLEVRSRLAARPPATPPLWQINHQIKIKVRTKAFPPLLVGRTIPSCGPNNIARP